MIEIIISGLIILGLIILALIIILAIKLSQKKHFELVKNYSDKYKALILMNEEILFSSLGNLYYHKSFKIKRDFEKNTLEEIALEYIRHSLDIINSAFKAIQNNINLYDIYCQKYQILLESESTNTNLKISKDRYNDIEKKLLAKNKLMPQISINLTITKSYTSDKGKNHYNDSGYFDYNHIKHMHAQILDDLTKKSSEHYRRRIERSKVTDGIRFDVFKRDGFRCKICGASADSRVKLHVDHIKPISKGGDSNINNLQTLCESCNMGKSDKYDEGENWINLQL
ncbi:MAG: HNH endonuclease [Firmicutes bacterium]|nr:HNH endonuclease [Bacillota bacterium]